MALALGVDTGGTYTDAVLVRDEAQVVASAKALTTRGDLAVGVAAAISAVLAASGAAPDQISLAALSTTLATNALVEGQGGRVALIYIGFGESDLERHGLSDALKGDPALVLAGGHDHAGAVAAPLELSRLSAFLETVSGVSGFAVAARFATRNPAHELEAARLIQAACGAPVTCSHQLSTRLNGPKRAVTAVLNARLIGMIDALIGRTQHTLDDLGITAPLMVVRGDGALMSAGQARDRPIETILSGPAASIVGARWLTGASDALVSDIGGTTTDIAVLRGGRPAIDPAGARVGTYRTMVEAVAMRTHGLGGDSQVHVRTEGLAGGVFLGPRRVLPVSLMAAEHGQDVHDALDRQLRAPAAGELDARFARRIPGNRADTHPPRETALLDRLGDRVLPLATLLQTRTEHSALARLVDRGVVQVSGITPSDASHVLGTLDTWDRPAAEKALELMSRKRVGSGDRLAAGPVELARIIIDQLTDQTVLALLESAFEDDSDKFGLSGKELARHVLTRRGLDGHRGLVRLDVALDSDVVGLGASAPAYYPVVGTRLNCRVILPEHAAVANAIGAVVGRVTIRRSGTVTVPDEGRYRVHTGTGAPQDFADADTALSALESILRTQTEMAARTAGAGEIQVAVERDIRMARVEARDILVEATLTVEASGRPRVAIDP